jgi:hypothetical protein
MSEANPGRQGGARALDGGSCPGCGGQSDWLVPDCVDGHGLDCPERFCARCGMAVWGGVLVSDRRAG